MSYEKRRGNPGLPKYDRTFYSYDSRSAATLTRVAEGIRQLHVTVNLLEEQYEKIWANMTAQNASEPTTKDFKLLHHCTETILHQLATFFKIPVDRDTGVHRRFKHKHKYHEAVIKVFTFKDNPLTPILGCRDVQNILFSWKKWRNHWKEHSSYYEDDECFDESITALTGMPNLIRKLREAISEANSIAEHGVQVIRGERGAEQMNDTTNKDQRKIPHRGGRPYARRNFSKGNSCW